MNKLEKRLLKLDIILASLMLLFPLLLIIVNGEVRPSISNYAYSKYNYVFVSLLTVAGTMFIFNGTAYNTRWYNIVLGCSLIGVALTPHIDFPIIHYAFAGLFFLGSVATMIIYSSREQRRWKIKLGLLIILLLAGVYVTKKYSLFVAEWIGILPISFHYIGEGLGKID